MRKAQARKHLFEALEERQMLAGDLVYEADNAAPLTLRLSGGTVEIINSNTSGVLASEALSDITTGVRIEGNEFDVRLTIDDSVPIIPGGVLFVGGTGNSTLVGPEVATDWDLTGAGAGTVTFSTGVITFQD
ncbi:MAG TPA: hypothetical protein VFV87_10640, partial [Pirellulaceae bacterium]|nr:hypothetical protein [Pirellulaceae bacterium]